MNKKLEQATPLTAVQKYNAWTNYLSSIHGKTSTQSKLYNELLGIRENPGEIEARFADDLDFRESGIDAAVGVGTSRMNPYMVRKFSMGFAAYIAAHTQHEEGYAMLQRGVVVAYDSREHSHEFALEAAKTLASFQLQVYLFETPVALPQLSYAVRSYGAIAGLYVTSDSGSVEYSGIKVLDLFGCGINTLAANDLNAFVQAQKVEKYLAEHWKKQSTAYITHITQGADDDYDQDVLNLLLNRVVLQKEGAQFPILYAPLQSLARIPLERISHKAGMNVSTVTKPTKWGLELFPHVPDENEEVYEEVFEIAKEQQAKLILTTNYTGTELRVFVNDGENYVQLSGNQVGELLLFYIAESRKKNLPFNATVAINVFTSELVRRIAEKYKLKVRETPVGFRYIGEVMDNCITEKGTSFMLGFESDNRFVAGDFVRVADGIQTALLVSEMAVIYGKEGKTLLDKINDLYNEFGYAVEEKTFVASYSVEEAQQFRGKMNELRFNPPHNIGYEDVVRIEDFLLAQSADYREVGTKDIPITRFAGIKWRTDKGSWVGVEFEHPEEGITLYYGTLSNDRERAEFHMAEVEHFVQTNFLKKEQTAEPSPVSEV